MTVTKSGLRDTLSPQIRKMLVAERLGAMRGSRVEVASRLQLLLTTSGSLDQFDRLAVALLWSELLHLDGQSVEALTIFDDHLNHLLKLMPISIQIVVSDNLSDLQISDSPSDADIDGVRRFYHAEDKKRVAEFEVIDRNNIVAAQDALESNKFPEAMRLLWQNLLRAYSLGSWRETKWVSERLAKLYLKIGDLNKACHYMILAEAENQIEHLASAVASRGDPVIIRSILRRLMNYSNLRRHFIVGCKFVAKIPDLIPDEDIASVVQWLLPRCSEPASKHGCDVMSSVWKTVRELGYRIPKAHAQRFVETAINHPEWQSPLPGENRVIPNREVLIDAVAGLVPLLPKPYLSILAEATLPLATDRVQDFDYSITINVLLNMARLGGEELKRRISSALYIPGKPVNRVLAHVAGLFGVEALTPQQWEEFANRIIDETRLTVQRLKPGETAKPVAEVLMTMMQPTSSGEIQVTIQSGYGLNALIRGKKHLSDGTIDRVVEVLLEMATNRDNIFSNRANLLSVLCKFADRVTPERRTEVVRTLGPLARGEVQESTDYPNSTVGRHPLSPIRANLGSPQQVQAVALVAAATYCGSESERYSILEDAVSDGFVSDAAAIRRGAYAAAGQLTLLSGERLLPLLMGLRDPDPDAAVAAFSAFARRNEWELTRPMWKLFILSTRLASQSQDSNLRWHAAKTLRARLDQLPTSPLRREGDELLDYFSNDISFSVREIVKVATLDGPETP